MKRINHSYYVVMIDYDKLGREANVDPEMTRRGVVDRLVSGEWGGRTINFIHHIDGGLVEDVTAEFFEEAEAVLREIEVA